ncbi:hypothetical protein ACFQLX_17885 [Streptomyces polyrhachis]|uniref:Uncharacterized protein n=1 Tax=Streptomyces polyrhachis TaxID=1282885 RepID=A0ABW2GLS1_9ACTN
MESAGLAVVVLVYGSLCGAALCVILAAVLVPYWARRRIAALAQAEREGAYGEDPTPGPEETPAP